MIKISKIVQKSDGYYVVSHTTGKNLGGPYPNRARAQERLGQVQAFKHMKKQGAINPYKALSRLNLIDDLAKGVSKDMLGIKVFGKQSTRSTSALRNAELSTTYIKGMTNKTKLINKLLEKTAKMSEYKVLKKYKVTLSPEERAECLKRKAVWHHGPNGEPTSAVWKSVNPKTGETTYVTNTHRAYRTGNTLKSAIREYHDFIKSTA